MQPSLSCRSAAKRGFVCVLLIFAATLAAAADKLQLVDDSADLRVRATRLQLARELAAEIGGVARRLPTLSPSDEAMVATEMSEIGNLTDDTAVDLRARQLYRSVRFQQERLRETLQRAGQALRCAAEERNPPRREIACWAVAALHLNDRTLFEEAISTLRTGGRVPRDGDTPAGKWSALPARFSLYGRAIQERLVIPYLAGELR